MSKWLSFLADPNNQDMLSMLARHPRKSHDSSPYQVPMLMQDPERVMAVVVGSVLGSYEQDFVAIDPTGPLAWQVLSRRMVQVIDKNSPRCVFVVCGPAGDTVFPVVDSRHVVVRLSCSSITPQEANTLIQAAANV